MLYSSLELPSLLPNTARFSTHFSALLPNLTRYARSEHLRWRFDETDFFLRRDTPSRGDLILTVWVFGLIVNEIKLLYQYGFKV